MIENSPEASNSDVADMSPNIVYRHIENRGYGNGHNHALKEVVSENPDGFHLVLNADIWWDGQIISELLNYIKENPDVGMVMPKVLNPDGSLQYTCRMLPTPIELFANRFLPETVAKKIISRYLLKDLNHNKPINAPYLMGCFLLFRNKALKDCGLFDERFFLYPEDIDITRRIHEKWKTMYWPGVTIKHEHQRASRKSLKLLGIHTINMIRYFNKWGWWTDVKRKQYNKELFLQ